MALKEIPLHTVFLTIPALEKLQGDVRYYTVVRAHEALRYQIFDLGKLLLRNDSDGERNKKWRQKTNEIIEGSLKTFLPDVVDGKLPHGCEHHLDVRQKNDHLFFIFNGIEDRLSKLGTSVLEPDQHEFYIEELGTALHRCQQDIISGLKVRVENGTPEMECLRDIEWATFCCNHALSRPQHEFSVRQAIENEKLLNTERIQKNTGGLYKNTFGEICLLVDEIEGDLARYDKDIDLASSVLTKRGDAPVDIVEGEDFLVPLIDWSKLDFTKEFFKAVEAAVPANPDPERENFYHIVTAPASDLANDYSRYGGKELPNEKSIPRTPRVIELLLRGMAKIEKHRLFVQNIVVGKDIADALKPVMEGYGTLLGSNNELEPIGEMYGAKIYETERIDANIGYVFAEKEFVGRIPVRFDGKFGLCITNVKGIAKIIL